MVVIHNHTEYTLNIVIPEDDVLIYVKKDNSIKYNRIKSFPDAGNISVYIDDIKIYEGIPSCKYLHVINSTYQVPSMLAKLIKQNETRKEVGGNMIMTYSYLEDHGDISKMCTIRKVCYGILLTLLILLYLIDFIDAMLSV